MLFNIKEQRVSGTADCLKCDFFKNKKCEGLGKVCFEFDPITQTIFDNITHLPKKLKVKENKNNGH